MYTDQPQEKTEAIQETQLEACKDRAGQVAAAIESALSRVGRLRQKLEGTDRAEGATEPTPVPNGLLDEIGHVQSSSCKSLDLISMELDALERLI